MGTAHIAAARRRLHEAALALTAPVAAIVAALPGLSRLVRRQAGRAGWKRRPPQEQPREISAPLEPCADCPRRSPRNDRTDPDAEPPPTAEPAPRTPSQTGEYAAPGTGVGVLAYVVDGERTYPV